MVVVVVVVAAAVSQVAGLAEPLQRVSPWWAWLWVSTVADAGCSPSVALMWVSAGGALVPQIEA